MNTQAPREAADVADLRRRAEARLRASRAGDSTPEATTDPRRLLHELQVHQIELELQNEALRQAQGELEVALERYADFHDFSPAGFVTLNREGAVGRANLSAARLLGLDRSRLAGRRFGALVAEDQRQAFNKLLQAVFAGQGGQGCQLRLTGGDEPPRVVHMDALLSPDGQECRAVLVDVTEQQHTADQLREAMQFNAQVIDNAQEGIVVYGPDLRYRVWNGYMENFTGMRSADVLGRLPVEVFPFLKDGGVTANLNSALAGLMSQPVEFPFRVSQSGRSGWAQDRNSPLRNVEGEVIGVIGTVSDITESRRVQESLAASLDFARSLLDSMQDGFSLIDPQGVHLDVNPSLCRITGFSREELVGSGLPHRYWPPEECESIQAAFGKVVSGELDDLELTFMRKNGERFPVLLTPAVLRDAAGQIVNFIATVKDISRHKQAEAALRTSEQRFRDIVNTTDGIVWEADANSFDFTFVSRQAERLLGYPVAEWLQPGFWVQHLHPEDKDWAAEYCMSCTRRGVPHDFEYRFEARDGRIVWLHDIVTVVEENGAPRWLRGIMVDITRRRKTEEALVELAENLEARVGERTAQLRKLAAQMTMTEERERRMLAQDLHDNLGQLLAVIQIKLSSLPDAEQSPSITQVVELVGQADRAARSITQQLSPPVMQRLGLGPALEWLGEEIGRVYGLKVHVDAGECSGRLVEEIQAVLYRAARELLINVARHAAVGEASLTCLRDAGNLVLAVSDAGRGFDPADHFGDWAGHHSFGLRAIHERIINLGGEVDIDSSPGNGTTVTLRVPRRIGEKEIGDDPDNACR